MKRILSKREDVARRWRSFQKHVWLLLQPFAAALAAVAAWWFLLRERGIHLPKEDEVVILAGPLLFLSVAYGITVATTFESVWEKYQTVVKSVLKRDKDTFLCYRDERIPIVLHLLIISFSVPIMVIVALVEYHAASTGFLAVFSTAFVLTLYWVVVAELQDPSQSLWFAERIPAEWLTADIDEHFKLDENGHAAP